MTGYHADSDPNEMAADTQFAFTEGHIRLLLLMCDQQAEQLQSCVDEALRHNEQPSDVLLNCREGVLDLKSWALRLLDHLEYSDEDEEQDEVQNLEEDFELQAFRQDLILRSQIHRVTQKPRERPGPIQKLRLWLLSVLVRFLTGKAKS